MLIPIQDGEDEPPRNHWRELLDELALYSGSSSGGGQALPPQWQLVPSLTSRQWNMSVNTWAGTVAFAIIMMQ